MNKKLGKYLLGDAIAHNSLMGTMVILFNFKFASVKDVYIAGDDVYE